MPSARIVWTEHGEFLGSDRDQHAVRISSQGRDTARGINPTDLFLVSLASCTGVTFLQVMKKKRQAITALEIEIKGSQAPEPPWRFEKIQLLYRVRGEALDPRAIARSIELAESKYCAVVASLSEQVELESAYEALAPE